MPDSSFLVPRLDDPTVVKLFRVLEETHKPQGFHFTIIGIGRIDPRNEAQFAPIRSALEATNSYLVADAYFGFGQFNINYYRGGDPSKQPSPTYDEIKIRFEPNENEINRADRIKLLNALYSRIGPTTTAGAFTKPPSFDDLEALYRSTILKLETAFSQQIERMSKWATEQGESAEKRRIELSEETQREREALRKEYEDRQSLLSTTASELEKKRQELDDRDYMHARRAIRGDLQRIIAAREKEFTLTPGTRQLRTPIHLAMVVLILCLLSLNIGYFWIFTRLDLSASWGALITPLVKQGALAAVLIAAVLYYVRWMNNWFEQHANAEFLLKQFQLDVDRASWIVETALEWRRAEKTELPAPLLEGIARNLFSSGGTGERTSSRMLKKSFCEGFGV
jgi:hypothetical protein